MGKLEKTEFVIVDVETTGLSPLAGDRIVEIAALKIRNLRTVDEFHSFVNPEREISFGAYMVNGISDDMVKKAPRAKGILPKVLDFVGEAHLIGHNINFDLSFLCHELSLLGLGLKASTGAIDTMRMAKKLMPYLGRYPLWYVAQSLGIDTEQKHRAMADVHLTFQVFQKLVEVAQRKDIDDIGSFVQVISERRSRHSYMKDR